ncbi:alpha/beta hydrolase [Sphingobium sp. CR2-8]|uniref:alpha/beta hydrolase n=1 Tax=Sphingobium sp. CR2-8 TaxID=1306534 RepID=UPI002DBE0281|nr:alpha/beta hydrolase [Sphingobium sp. CR2-8]MEC3912734.1 alpha/beta hydrolase [Sphingobium sp. CR2-8]
MTPIDRRTLLAGTLAGAALTSPALAQTGAKTGTRAVTQTFPLPSGFERFPIWPGKAPGGERVTVQEQETLRQPDSQSDDTAFSHVTTPTLTLLRPETLGVKPNGAAMLLIPGGGYTRVAIGKEGYAIARRFAQAGYTCFALVYRLPADGWTAGAEAPLQDAQRALRIVQALGKREKFDAERVGVMGFSAGGHLAAWLTSRTPQESYAPVDASDREPIKAAIAAYMYPVIQMEGPFVHAGSRMQLLGANPTAERLRAYSLDQDVSAQTPPIFLAHALNDVAVPPENSLAMLAALRAKKIPVECHLFENGNHGFGLSAPPAAPAPWPDLFLSFARRHGL